MKRLQGFFAASVAELKNIRSLTLASLLTAIYAVSYSPVAGNFVLVPGLIEIRFGFLAIAVAGMLVGPVAAMLVAALGDVLGTVLFYGGSFVPGYTVIWMAGALVFGCFLYRGKYTTPRILGAATVYTVFVNLLLTTWIHSTLGYGPFVALFVSRLPLRAVMFPVNTALLFLVLRTVAGIYRRIGRTA